MSVDRRCTSSLGTDEEVREGRQANSGPRSVEGAGHYELARYIMRTVAEDGMLLMGTIYFLLVAVTNIKFCGPLSMYSFFLLACVANTALLLKALLVCEGSLSACEGRAATSLQLFFIIESA